MEINKKYWTQVAKWTKSILSYVSFFNINDLNSLILKTQFIRMDLKNDQILYCLQETHIRFKDTNKLKLKEWENIFNEN